MTQKQLSQIIKTIEISSANKSELKQSVSTKCQNALDGSFYPFNKGSKEEKDLYRVMPVDGSEKLYFNSDREYKYWTKRRKP